MKKPAKNCLIFKTLKKSPVGKSEFGHEILLLDEEGNPVPDGTEGEVCFENKYVRGYMNLSAENEKGKKRLYKQSIGWIALISAVILVLMFIFSSQIVGIFFETGSEIFALTEKGFKIFLLAGLFVGYNTFASALLTAFLNGRVSALLSIFRTLILLIIMLIVLPLFFGENGLWFAWPVTEAIAFIVSIFVVRKYRKSYHY